MIVNNYEFIFFNFLKFHNKIPITVLCTCDKTHKRIKFRQMSATRACELMNEVEKNC